MILFKMFANWKWLWRGVSLVVRFEHKWSEFESHSQQNFEMFCNTKIDYGGWLVSIIFSVKYCLKRMKINKKEVVLGPIPKNELIK